MKIRTLFFALTVLLSLGTLNAQQPYAGCWHPDFIKDWTPEKDPDRKFNRSSVPLQTRIPTAETMKAHSQQFPDGQVAACLTMHPMCSQVPAQGANNFIGYNPTYWQYLDLLIWWGGSAGEGIILPPSAPVIDAAHLNGTKVLGQIFFPPTAFSGLPAWTTQMNTKDPDGTFPYARKCVEIAEYYGFDGWFINSETVTSTNWGEWTADYLAYAKSKGMEGQEIQVYVMSSTTSGAYIEDVAKQPGGSYMVNYGGASANNVSNRMNSHVSNGWGDKADAFRTWYYGVEQSGSITGNGFYFNVLFPTTGHAGSINFFNPEEPIWKKTVGSLLNTPNASGEQAYTAMQTVFNNESKFWVNASANVTNQDRGSGYAMTGLATAIQERSVIQTKPFITTFSAGLGKHRFVNGEKKGTQDWYHRGMQTIMPTWRWWQTKGFAATTDLKFGYDWDDAYNIGTSISISGNLANSTDYNVYLYKTKIAVESGDKIQLVYKTNKPGSIKIKVADSSNSLNLQPLTVAPVSTTKNGWTIDEYDLSALAGKTLTTIGLGINAADGNIFTAQLGQLAVYPANYTPAATQVSNLNVENTLGEDITDLRIVWDKPASTDIHHFNVYLEREGVKALVGQTRNEGFYIPKFARNGQNEKSVKVSVTTVNKKMEEAATGPEKEVFFPDIKLSEVTLKASKTLVAVGEEITVTARATSFPETYTWKQSDGVTLKSSNGNTAVYTFTKEGLFDIGVDVKNAVGTTSYTETKFINVSASSTLEIVSRTSHGGSIKDVSSYMTASNEGPQWLIDNNTIPGSVNQKWCAGGEKEHWVILELDQPYELYRFQIYDCGNKENASDNLTHYKIYTSLSGKDNDWTLALDEKDVPADAAHNVKDDYIKPTLGRYVKFVPYNPDMAITIRIWQFDVWGVDVPLPPFIGTITSDKELVKPNEEVTFTVEASGDPVSYEWTVKGGTLVSQTDNKATYKFALPGIYDVTVTATNENGTSDPKTETGIVEVSKVKMKGIVPLTIEEGLDIDLIAENTPSADFASSIDSQGWAFYTAGAAEEGAIPLNNKRELTSANGTLFRFAPYNENNAVLLKDLNERTITFKEKYTSEAIYILAASANGFSVLYVSAKYTDGTSSPALPIMLYDWCGSSANTAIGTIGRIKLKATEGYEADQTDVQCRMYENKVTLDPSKTLASLTVSKMGGGFPAIFAISSNATYELMTLEQPQDVTVKETKSQHVEAAFTLNMDKSNLFMALVTPEDNTIVKASNIRIDETTGKIGFDLTGLAAGETDVFLTLVNGTVDLSRTFKVTTVDIVRESIDPVAGFTLKTGEQKSMEVGYSLGEIEKAANFGIVATATDPTIIFVSTLNIEDEKVKFDVNALKVGETTVKISLTNGENKVEREFTVTVETGNGIPSVDASTVKVWPNPVKAGEKITVEAEGANVIRLLSLQGILISEQTVKDEIGKMSTSNLPAGTYILQVIGENTNVSKVIIR
jgi:endo-beta-N-acetylglucosaminidase D/PKD repeat protein